MHIVIVDAESVLSAEQEAFAHDRLAFSLARFGFRISGATAHISLDEETDTVCWAINVNLDSGGIVSVVRRAATFEKALNSAAGATENKVAFRVDWQSWVNADRFATWVTSTRWALSTGLGSLVNATKLPAK